MYNLQHHFLFFLHQHLQSLTDQIPIVWESFCENIVVCTAVPTFSYWFTATVSKINEKAALHCNMHITKMLTDILQLFVWI